jgi:hypothetical protein
MGATSKPFLTATQNAFLKDWLKRTKLKERMPIEFVTLMSDPKYDWDLGKYLADIKTDSNAAVGSVWEARITMFSNLIGGLASDFIRQRLSYSKDSGNTADVESFERLYIRIGEAIFITNDLSSDDTTRSKLFKERLINKDGSLRKAEWGPWVYGMWRNNTITKTEGKDFRTVYGYPKTEKSYKLYGLEYVYGTLRTKKNAWFTFNQEYRYLFALATLIAHIDLAQDLNVRQRRALFIESLSRYLPGQVTLEDGRVYYCQNTKPPGAQSTLLFNVAPEGDNPGYVPGVTQVSGWFVGMEYLVEDSLIPYTQRVNRDDIREAQSSLNKGATATQERRAAAAARLAEAQAKVAEAQAAAAAGAASAKEAADAASAAQASLDQATNKQATAGRSAKTLIGGAIAAVGAYYIAKNS